MFTPLGLDHVVFRVTDQAVSQRFYVDVLGCTLDHVNERISLIHLRFGEHYIDLLPATAQAPASVAGGVDHVCLSIRCDDLAGVADELRRRGVVLEGEVVPRRGAYGTGPSLYLRDPDGHVIELKPRPGAGPGD
jgi:catechol 2,3-dioxygenase-like lactoylglutathione lyase family enzyme